MTALTLQQQFGTNATLSNGVLSIHISDLTSVGLNGSSPSPSDIAAALVLHWQANQGTNADQDNTIGVVVGTPFRTLLSRNNINQIQYQYPVSFYVPDTLGTTLDPDSVV